MFEFSNLENHPELYGKPMMEVLEYFNIKSPESPNIDELAVLGVKAYAHSHKGKNEVYKTKGLTKAAWKN